MSKHFTRSHKRVSASKFNTNTEQEAGSRGGKSLAVSCISSLTALEAFPLAIISSHFPRSTNDIRIPDVSKKSIAA